MSEERTECYVSGCECEGKYHLQPKDWKDSTDPSAWPIEKFAEEQRQALVAATGLPPDVVMPAPIPPKLLTEPGETVEQMIKKLDGDVNSKQYRLEQMIKKLDGDVNSKQYRLEQIKIRVKLASENRLTMPLTLYVNDVTFLLNQLGIELEKE